MPVLFAKASSPSKYNQSQSTPLFNHVNITALQTHFNMFATPTPQGFSRFLELPTELQMLVWSHAIDNFHLSSRDLAFFEPAIPFLNPEPYWFTPVDKAITKLRRTLLRTCRLSRLRALEVWMQELCGVPVTVEVRLWAREGFDGAKKERALNNLEFLIAELRR